MKNYQSISFIGGGRITYLLLKALHKRNALPQKVIVSDPNPDVLKKVESISPEVILGVTDNLQTLQADLVFLAVHPPIVKQVAEEIQNQLKDDTILVSLAPAVSIEKLSQLLGGFKRLARMIPNAPSIVHQGYNPVVFHNTMSFEEKSKLLHFFHDWGASPEVEESKLEAYAVLTAMGPTYFWFQWQELQHLGTEFELNEDELQKALPAMLHGAVDTLFKSDLSQTEAMDLIPVCPLKEQEEAILKIYREALLPLHQKLTGK